MKKLTPIFLLWLTMLGLTTRLQAQPDAADVQYYWATQNRVYLWRTPEDIAPVIANYDPNSNLWSISTNADGAWLSVLRRAARNYLSENDISSFTQQQLWAKVLTGLRNDFEHATWATHRTPSSEIYFRKLNDQTVELIILWKDKQGTKEQAYKFTRQTDGTWKKNQNIDLSATIGLSEKSDEIRKVFDIPKDASLPQKPTDWNALWTGIINKFLGDEESARPVIIRDNNDRVQLLWRERLSPEAAVPLNLKQIPPKPQAIKDAVPATTVATPEAEAKEGEYSFWLKATSLLIGLLVVVGTLFLLLKGWLMRVVRSLRLKDVARDVLISTEGATLLHKLLKERFQERSYTENESVRAFLLHSLDLVHQEYLSIINSVEFVQESKSLKTNIINEYQKELGVDPQDLEKIPTWFELGRAAEKAIPLIEKIKTSSYLNEAISNKSPLQFQSDIDWTAQWPELVDALNTLLAKYDQDCSTFKNELEEKNKSIAEELREKEQEISKKWEGDVLTLRNSLSTKDGEYSRTSQQLREAEESAVNLKLKLEALQKQLDEIQSAKEASGQALKEFERKAQEIQDVQKLSRYLRVWIQGYFTDQQQREDGDLRSVGLIAALINFSLYQICFSIIEDEQFLRKAMAYNLFRCAQIFNEIFGENPSYTAARETLLSISPGVEQAFNDLKNFSGHTLDDRLFQAFLSRLKTEGVNLGSFFVEANGQGDRITQVSAS